MSEGIDIHGGLRVTLEYNKEGRTIDARWSAESGVDVQGDVQGAIRRLRQRAGFLEAWLTQYRRQHGEPEILATPDLLATVAPTVPE